MIEISSDKKKLDIDFIHRFLKTPYWAHGIPRAILQKSIDNSFCFGMYRCRKQIGMLKSSTLALLRILLGEVLGPICYRKQSSRPGDGMVPEESGCIPVHLIIQALCETTLTGEWKYTERKLITGQLSRFS
jgi:hypothetical protein